MLSKKLQEAINEQINKEFFSEFLYLSMAAYCQQNDLDGVANYYLVQAQEEHFHAMKFFNFVIDKGGKVTLKSIDAPKTNFSSIIDTFEETQKHEQLVTKSINDLMALATKEDDYAVVSFLKWFIDEQVEEEATVTKLLGKLNIVDGKGEGLLMLDRELAARVFTPPPAA
ncbi:MAG: ferritin [Ignavibacteriae bacterium]|nr:MAG: ferritin [Ignavibacteriota bacterium]